MKKCRCPLFAQDDFYWGLKWNGYESIMRDGGADPGQDRTVKFSRIMNIEWKVIVGVLRKLEKERSYHLIEFFRHFWLAWVGRTFLNLKGRYCCWIGQDHGASFPPLVLQFAGDFDRDSTAATHAADTDWTLRADLLNLADVDRNYFLHAVDRWRTPVDSLGMKSIDWLVPTQYARQRGPEYHDTVIAVNKEQRWPCS
jgi:hypothetical protein